MNFGTVSLAAPLCGLVQSAKILPHSTTAGETSPVCMLCAGDGPLLVGISRDQASIYRKSLAADQPLLDTSAHHRFEDMPERIAVAEPTVPV